MQTYRTFVHPDTRPRFGIYVTLAWGLGLSYVSYDVALRLEAERDLATFRHEAAGLYFKIRNRLDDYKQLIEAVKSYLEADTNQQPGEWESFLRELTKNENLTGLKSVAYYTVRSPSSSSPLEPSQCVLSKFYLPKNVSEEALKECDAVAHQIAQAHQEDGKLGMAISEDHDRKDIHLVIPVFSQPHSDGIKGQLAGFATLQVDLRTIYKHITHPSLNYEINTADRDSGAIRAQRYENFAIGDHIKVQIWANHRADRQSALKPHTWVGILGVIFSLLVSITFWAVTTTSTRAKMLADQMSRDLRLTEQKNQAIVQNIPGAIFRAHIGGDSRYSYFSDYIMHMTGYPASMFVSGQKLLYDLVHPDDLAKIEKTVGLSPQVGHRYTLEYRIHDIKGRERWVQEMGHVTAGDTLTTPQLTGVIFDITERKQREYELKKLSKALEYAVEGIAFINQEHKIVSANEAFCSFFFRPSSEMTHAPWIQYLDKDSQSLIVSGLEASQGDLSMQFIVCHHANPQRTTILDVVLIPLELHLDNFSAAGYYCFARDITDKSLQEKALASALREAERASRAKSDFLATMSHELRTPLNAIIGYSEILFEEAKDIGLDEVAVKDIKRINAAGKHLLELINDILDVSKLEAGKVTLFFEDFDVANMAKSITEIMEPTCQQNGNVIMLEIAEDVGHMYSDLTKVRQSLFNLLSNASKFTHDGTITLSISKCDVDDGEWYRFVVHDTGIGMTEEQMQNLFKPFTQADSSTTRRFGGTGLGLTITKRFCEMLGGDITASSTFGTGSRFTVMLPCRASDTSNQADRPSLAS
ncbi:MAG: PAS domain-containing sensor histidine kinase [Holosporales bacterium]